MITTMDNVNDKLFKLYSKQWCSLCEALDNLSVDGMEDYEKNPLLLRIDDSQKYEKADLRIMIFGQDMSIGDWYKYNRHTALEDCMKNIKTFRNSIGSVDINTQQTRQSRGFGGGVNKFIDILRKKMPGCEIQFVWNDLAKIGRNIKGNPNREKLEEIENKYFNVTIDEINCLNPDFIIFMTGPAKFWESRLKSKLNNPKTFDCYGYSYHDLCLLEIITNDIKTKSPSVNLAFRTYHPCARGKKKTTYYQSIAEIIKRKYIFENLLIDFQKIKGCTPIICSVNDEKYEDQIVEDSNISYWSNEWLSIGYIQGNYYACITYGLNNNIELGIRRAPGTLKKEFNSTLKDYPDSSNIWWYCKKDIDKEPIEQNISTKELILKLTNGLSELLDFMNNELSNTL